MMRIGRTPRIRVMTLLPVGIGMLLVLGGALFSVYFVTGRNIDLENRHRLKEMETAYESTLKREGNLIRLSMAEIGADEAIQEAFAAADRDELMRRSGPLYERLKDRDGITHFYYLDPNGICLLRVHDPDRAGDEITRLTLERARRSGRIVEGVELGRMGSLTLRVVMPWRRDGELLGYLELGKEVQTITGPLRETLDLDMELLVQKRFLDREDWEAGKRVFGLDGNWDRFYDYLLVDGNEHDIHDGMLASPGEDGDLGPVRREFRVEAHDREHMGGALPLTDCSGTRIGLMVGIWDATEYLEEQRAVMATFGWLAGVGSVLLLAFLVSYLGRVQERMDHSARVLRETVVRQREDADAVLRNKQELQREMKQRIRAESDLKKQVLELAEARAAAMNIMEDSDLARKSAENSNRELAEAMAETERLRQEAVDASLSKSEFLANMSHEIRTPMNGVLGMTDLLFTTDLTPQQEDYLSVIHTSGKSLLEIINDILDFSKIEAGMMELEVIEFDPWETVEGVCETVAVTAQNKNLELITCIGPEVPALVRGDAGRLRQVLVNLVGNALKFTSVGEICVTVEPDSDNPALLRFGIRDTGIGIAPDREAGLFDAFSQADSSTTRRFGGTGLGLSISRRLVELMGGEIGLHSDIGVGSEFWFTARLPAVEGTAVRAATNWRTDFVRGLIAAPNETLRVWLRYYALSQK